LRKAVRGYMHGHIFYPTEEGKLEIEDHDRFSLELAIAEVLTNWEK
jgi:hypothetical protein